METTRSEDTLIFLALNPKITNFSLILDQLRKFMNAKQSVDPTDRFNFIIFEENRPVYLEDFTFNGDLILSQLKELKSKIIKSNMAGGIFVAITFIIDVFKTVGGKTFRLLIITDKNTPRLKNFEVVQDLVKKIVNFPFFIDVIRIGVRDSIEDSKWKSFAESTGKGLLKYTNNEKELGNVLIDLAKKKLIKLKGYVDSSKFKISSENEMFFENIAESPRPILNEKSDMKCQICGSHRHPDYLTRLYKCGKCDVSVHRECLALWSSFSNIGYWLYHLFRCQNCFNLLKLPKKFVEDVLSGKKPEEIIMDTSVFSDIADILLEHETERGGKLKLVTTENPFPFESDEDEIKETVVKKEKKKRKKVKRREKKKKITVLFCPSCGKVLTSEYKFCSGCGFSLK